MLKPSDRLDLYIASLMVVCEKQFWLARQLQFCWKIHVPTLSVPRALVVACIHGCCSWNIVEHIYNATWSPWANVAVCIMSLLNARNTIPIVLFRCKTWRSKFPRLSQISTKFADAEALCLCHCSHLQLEDMHLKFCMTPFQWILRIFYFIRV